jgi:hypothetical protein
MTEVSARKGDMVESSHLRAEEVAAYIDDGASNEERAVVEAHLAECSACCDEVIAVARLCAKAESRRRNFWVLGGSVAAAAVLALFLIGQPWKDSVLSEGEPPSIQRGTGTASVVLVLSPLDGSSLTTAELIFSWRPTDGELALYRLVLTTENGDSVWAATTRDTTLVPPAGTVLEQGTTYLWYVDALLPDGRPTSTGVHYFRIQE